MKRFFALILVLSMVLAMIPGALAAKSETPTPLTEEDYILANLMWEEVTAKEASMTAKRAPLSQTVEALIATVTASPYYQEDSLIRNGDHFFWETVDGIACGYSPRLFELGRNAEKAEDWDTTPTTVSTSYTTRGNQPGAKDVYLIQPYYGLDKDFTTQYVTESQRIAKALGGTATTYRTTGATIDAIADAIETGAVVIFDSHGDTDYINPNDSDDYATRANTSYICLQTGEGLTLNDMQKATGKFGEYYHAYYAGFNGSMNYYCVNGTAIANHMETNASNSMLWMALCLSMTTDGLHGPLMKKGVGVTYGYSQSVTFDYDYEWENTFWSEMLNGKTVAEAIAYMKDVVGPWDWCHGWDYDTLEEARAMYCAFPIVVSAEDVYPGHGKVDDYQTVRSTWVLGIRCSHPNVFHYPAKAPTCYETGNIGYYRCGSCNSYFADAELTTELTWEQIELPAESHNYEGGIVTIPPTCTEEGYTIYSCNLCSHSYTDNLLPPTGHSYTPVVSSPTCTEEGFTTYTCSLCNDTYIDDPVPLIDHTYENGSCSLCGKLDLPNNPFVDVKDNDYFYTPVLWALKEGITTGTSSTTFGPGEDCTRAQVVTFLWRASGCPEPTATENPFADIQETDYYYKAVLWAVEQGITNGTGNGRFSPNKPCTRSQVATFLWRLYDMPTVTESTNPFSDVAYGAYYYNAVLWAVEQGITNGTGKGLFSPDDSCTRGQIVTFLYRAVAHR